MAGGGEHGRDARIRAHARDEVFPGLEVCIWLGALVGLLSSLLIAGLLGYSDWELLSLVGTGVGLGAIVGLFAGLGRGVWRPGTPVRVPEPEVGVTPEPVTGTAPAPELWDPWLDHGRDLDVALPEVVVEEPAPPAAEIPEVPVLARAPVRPRVISPETGEAIRLDDEIGPMIQEGRGGLIVLLGGSGSGKTTALQHLAAILPPWARGRVRLLEDLDLTAIASAGPDPLVILALDPNEVATPGHEKVVIGYPGHEQAILDHLVSSGKPSLYRLAPWDQDDAIEYLLATDREACASVMGRLKASRDFSFLDGIPELCSVVLDRMAHDESIGDVRAALRGALAARIAADSIPWDRIQDRLVEALRTDSRESLDATASKVLASCQEDPGGIARLGGFARLIRHRPSALLLAADRIAALIEEGRPEMVLALPYPRELVLEVARQVVDSPKAIRHLSELFDDTRGNILVLPAIANLEKAVQPLAASVLHAATPGWRPTPGGRPKLEGAYLDEVAWPGQDLAGVNLRGATMRGADLSGANLERADAKQTCLRGAKLQGADLRHVMATQADLGRANLARARAKQARLRGADLTGALLIDADLWKADLVEARIDGAEFTGANLEDSNLKGLPLRLARLDGARFGGADLSGCDLEAMSLTEADFHDAKLCGATLTDSRLPGVNFRGANLRDAKLAEIDWPGACLRDADLRGANFHLGTTRSGKLDSPIACEGSRTGFYTHDDLDRHIRPAEEIRKANLRGADLRGALIGNVDFYLVDLRDARYTDDQAKHLRRCRAILDDGSA
jgi:uncharacterized protein YjbI with pentapeptide repeats/energy-coupling factor transporter ATP-binding protein EcfA2